MLPGSPSTPSTGNGTDFLQAGHTTSADLVEDDAPSSRSCDVHSLKHTIQNVCRHGKALGSVTVSLHMPHLVRSSTGEDIPDEFRILI